MLKCKHTNTLKLTDQVMSKDRNGYPVIYRRYVCECCGETFITEESRYFMTDKQEMELGWL